MRTIKPSGSSRLVEEELNSGVSRVSTQLEGSTHHRGGEHLLVGADARLGCERILIASGRFLPFSASSQICARMSARSRTGLSWDSSWRTLP